MGPSATPDQVLALIDILNPTNEPGRLTLIHRYGATQIDKFLPPLIETIGGKSKNVLWCCDPMHGNLTVTGTGVKTRRFDDILAELDRSFSIHGESGSVLGGVHFELTGDDVTECIGGREDWSKPTLLPRTRARSIRA